MPTVLAYATEKQAYFNLFMESCRRFGIEPVILGWGEQWEGTCKKLASICEYISELPEDEIVLSVDPFDVIFYTGVEEIEAKFRVMDIDWKCELFKNILFRNFITRNPDLRDIRFSGQRIINKSTGSMPSLLHASGNVRMNKIARLLGYDTHLTMPEKDMKNYSRKAAFHLGKILSFTLRQKVRETWTYGQGGTQMNPPALPRAS